MAKLIQQYQGLALAAGQSTNVATNRVTAGKLTHYDFPIGDTAAMGAAEIGLGEAVPGSLSRSERFGNFPFLVKKPKRLLGSLVCFETVLKQATGINP